MATNIMPEPLPRRALPATVEAAAECKRAALKRAEAQILHRIELELLESEEPPCTCRMNGGDLFDPRGCEAHDPNSPWNVALRAATILEQYEPIGKEPVECPF